MSSFFPIRCFTCNKVINRDCLYKKYKEEKKKKDALLVLDELNIKKACCRRMFLSHVDIEDELLMYDTPGMENFAKSEWKLD
jgi:DNA-directed RNA polymerase subunit N (RpoN/RPB10)